MEEPAVQPFDDPELKGALARVLDLRETLPAGLRDRIVVMTQEEAPRRSGLTGDKVRSTSLRWRRCCWWGLGRWGYRIWEMNRPAGLRGFGFSLSGDADGASQSGDAANSGDYPRPGGRG